MHIRLLFYHSKERGLFTPPNEGRQGTVTVGNQVTLGWEHAAKVGSIDASGQYSINDMKASSEYISVGANRSSSCAVCSAKGQVAFGAGRFVALWDSEVCCPYHFSCCADPGRALLAESSEL
jgi:hypothetical protein